jgi:hypothetical protein
VDNSATATALFNSFVVTSNPGTDTVIIPPLFLVVTGAPDPVQYWPDSPTYSIKSHAVPLNPFNDAAPTTSHVMPGYLSAPRALSPNHVNRLQSGI